MNRSTEEQAGCFPTYIPTFNRPWQVSSDLPTGEWHMIANGRLHILEITVASGNRFAANFSSGDILDGGWNADKGEISFRRFIEGRLDQEYVGYLMHSAEKDLLWRIAGTFYQENLDATSGWYMAKVK